MNQNVAKEKYGEKIIAAKIPLTVSMPVSIGWFTSMDHFLASKFVFIQLIDDQSSFL
jgi:hypothetical protein